MMLYSSKVQQAKLALLASDSSSLHRRHPQALICLDNADEPKLGGGNEPSTISTIACIFWFKRRKREAIL
jgi:hypothetical protein